MQILCHPTSMAVMPESPPLLDWTTPAQKTHLSCPATSDNIFANDREKTDTITVQGEAIQGTHAQNGMDLGVVLLLGPMGELAVEGFEGGEVQLEAEELFPHAAKKPLHLSLGRAVAHRRVGQQAADASADLDDFLGG